MPPPMPVRLSLLYLGLAALGLAAALVLGSSARSGAAISPGMTGYVMDGDLQSGLAFADGTEVGSTDAPYPVVPPGQYQVTIDDSAESQGFILSGIGVNVTTGIPDTGRTVSSVDLLPCVLYAYNDGRRFQTSGGPGSTTACTRLDTQVTGTVPTTTATRPTKTVAGGAAGGAGLSALGTPLPAATAGRLEARLAARGGPALLRNGKAVHLLAAGTYAIAVDDRSSTAGLTLTRTGGRTVTLSASRFVGSRVARLALTPGSWRLAAVPARPGAHTAGSLHLTVTRRR